MLPFLIRFFVHLNVFRMKKTLCVILAVLMPGIMFGSLHKVDLSDALKGKLVKLSAVNFEGGFTGRDVRLTVDRLSMK